MKPLLIVLLIALCSTLAAEPWDITTTPMQQVTEDLDIDRCQMYHLNLYDYLAIYSYYTDTGMAVAAKVVSIDEAGVLTTVPVPPSVISATSGANLQVMIREPRRFLIAWQDDAGMSYMTEAIMAPMTNTVNCGPVYTLDASGYVAMNFCYLGGDMNVDFAVCNYIAADGSAQAMLLKIYLASSTIETMTTSQIAAGPITSISTVKLVGDHLACAYTTASECRMAYLFVDMYTPGLQVTADAAVVPQAASHCTLTQLDEMSFAVLYQDAGGNGAAVRVQGDAVMGLITPGPEMPLGFALTQQPQLLSLGDDGILCFCPDAAQGAAKVITIDAMQNSVTLQSEVVFDADAEVHPLLHKTEWQNWVASWTNPTDPDAGGRCMLLDVEPLSPEVGTVQGMVTDAMTGEPIENAEILGSEGILATTDAAGMYSFTYQPGSYSFIAHHQDYQELPMLVHVVLNEVVNCDYELIPWNNPTVAYLQGFVYELVNGEQIPLSQAMVHLDDTCHGLTNDAGCFEIQADGGDHTLTITKPNYQNAALPVTLVLGDTLHVEVEMICQNMDTGFIAGDVFMLIGGPMPLPLEGAEISIADSVYAISDENGEFGFEIAVGTYEVHCLLDNFTEAIATAEVTPGETAVLTFLLEEVNPLLGIVEGLIYTEIGGQIQGLGDAEVYLGDECIAVADIFGFYHFVLEAGEYLVRVTAPGYTSVQEMVEVVAATSTDYSFFLIATDAEEQLPTPVVTLRNYPNPFNPTTTIQFSCQDASCTELALQIFNARGQKVRTLHIDQAQLQQGCISWDGTDATGKTASSGLYFYQLLNGTKPVASSKMLLMK